MSIFDLKSANPPVPRHRSAAHDAQRQRLILISFIGLLLAMAALAGLALAAHQSTYFAFDLQVARAVQSYSSEWFQQFIHLVNWPNFPPQISIIVGVIFVLLFFAYSRWAAIAFAFAALGIAVTQIDLKILVHRFRPSPDLIHVVDPTLMSNASGMGLSFPAGHPASALAVFGFLGYLIYTAWKPSRWRTLAVVALVIFISLIGYGRVYEGEHWLSDVIGGYLLGFIWLITSIYFYEWGRARFFPRQK